jgi:sterol 3beta-glucosyltransferase
MKILLQTLGSRGDVQPFIALGSELQRRGHDVAVSASAEFAPMIEAAGLRANCLSISYEALINTPQMKAAMGGFAGRMRAYRDMQEMMRRQTQEMWEVGLAERADLILYHPKGFLSPYLARETGAKAVPVFLQPGFAVTGAYPNFLLGTRDMGPALNRLSHRFLLGATRWGTGLLAKSWAKKGGVDLGARLDPLAGYGADGLRLHGFSPTLFPPPADWTTGNRTTGYFFADPAPFDPPAELSAFLDAGPPPIYAGFGSMPGMDPERQTRAVVEALKATGQRGIIATGWGGLSGDGAGPNILVLKSAPHPWLFPRVRAAIHHGGSGTTHESLRWGKPTIICPLMGDQPFFGEMVARIGAGPKPIPQKRLSGPGLADAIKAALDPKVEARADEIGRSIRAEPNGCAVAADLIDRLAV